jgi:hypothetical protein
MDEGESRDEMRQSERESQRERPRVKILGLIDDLGIWIPIVCI